MRFGPFQTQIDSYNTKIKLQTQQTPSEFLNWIRPNAKNFNKDFTQVGYVKSTICYFYNFHSAKTAGHHYFPNKNLVIKISPKEPKLQQQ